MDIKSKVILNLENKATSEIGIDVLKYYKGALYAIRNGGDDGAKHGFIKIALTNEESEIGEVIPLIMNHEKMDIPTIFVLMVLLLI